MKIARLLLGTLLLLAVATPLVSTYILRRYVDKERIVLATEKNINARVQLDEIALILFAWPPSLRLSGLKIGPRDSYAGTPIATRPPLQQALVQIETAHLEFALEGLFSGLFLPSSLRIIGVEVHDSISPQQGSALGQLFQQAPEKVAVIKPETSRALPPPPAEKRSKAARLALQEISLERAHFRITNQSADSRFDADISDLSLAFTEIDIDPDNLMAHNRLHVRLAAKVVVDGMAQIGGRMQPVRFADMTLHGDGAVAPVDPATRIWSPAADLNLVIDRGSSIGGNMTIGEAAGSNLDKLMKYGLDISAIRIGGTLAQDAVAAVNFRDQAIRFRSDTQFALPDYEYTIKRDSWMDFAKDQQGLLTRLSCGDALKQSVVNGVASRGLGQAVSKLIVEGLSDSRGRLSFDLTVTGSLSHPEVKPDLQIKLESLLGGDIEDKAKGLIDTFKGLKELFK